MMSRTLITLALLAVAAHGAQQKVNPVQKVISLLEKMQTETQEEGKAEAAAYDKFACFCKDTADAKLHSITKGKEHIATLTAEIEALATDISALASETASTREEKASTEATMEAEAAQRASEFAVFQSDDNDLQGAIDELERAINKLEGSKMGMMGAKVLFQKSTKAALKKLASAKDVKATPKQLKAIYALMQEGNPGDAHAFEFQSNKHIAVLKELLKTYKKTQFERQTEEEGTKSAFNMAQQARANQCKAFQTTIDKNEQIQADKEQEKSAKEADKTQTQADVDADQTFLDELTKECEDKAKAWDERSRIRSNELTAVAEALGLLKEGVQGNYNANKKLVLATQKVTPSKVEEQDDVEDEDDEDVSFLQRRDSTKAARRQAVKFLKEQAKVINSPALSALVMKMKEDHFKKVRGMIRDMVARLEDEAAAEASQKQWCDDNMSAAISQRDSEQAKIESEAARILQDESMIAKLTEEIADLGSNIADLYKALNEQTQLREEDHADNVKTLADAKAGLEALNGALSVLEKFYNDPSGFVQTAYEPFKAAGSGSDGKTVSDLAPGTFEGAYEGKQQQSKGVLGMLNVIKSDFERTISTTEEAESDAETEFQDFKSATETDISEKKSDKSSKEGEKENTNADLVEANDAKADAVGLKGEANEELEKLKPSCVSTGSSYDEKVARRKQEIEALKEATKILTDMR